MKGVELEELSKGCCDAWSDLDFADMVKIVEPFT
jgi:hypothetical protein